MKKYVVRNKTTNEVLGKFDTKEERVASLLTREDAKDVAERHFNIKIEEFLDSIKNL